MICATLANINDTSGRKWQAKDFLPDLQDAPPGVVATDEEAFAEHMRMTAALIGATVTKEE